MAVQNAILTLSLAKPNAQAQIRGGSAVEMVNTMGFTMETIRCICVTNTPNYWRDHFPGTFTSMIKKCVYIMIHLTKD